MFCSQQALHLYTDKFCQLVLDLIAEDGRSDKIVVLFGKADGSFEIAQEFWVDEVRGLRVGDAKADGYLDLYVDNMHSISIFLGRGDGTFVTQRRFPVGERPLPVTVADLDEDGSLDIVAFNQRTDDVSILFAQ